MGLLEDRETAARVRVEELRAEADRVPAALRDTEAVLERRVIAVAELAEALETHGPREAAGGPPEPVVVETAVAGSVVPHRREGGSVEVPAPVYRRIVELVDAPEAATGSRLKDPARGLGLEPVPGKLEGVRSKAKRLVARGWPAEQMPGVFTLPPRAGSVGAPQPGGPDAGS